MIGLVEPRDHQPVHTFQDEGDVIILLGSAIDPADPQLGLGSSALAQLSPDQPATPVPLPPHDITIARTLHTALLGLIQAGGLKSAHACGVGGLAATIALAGLSRRDREGSAQPIGATVDLTELSAAPETPASDPSTPPTPGAFPLEALLFGENPSRVLVTCAPLDATKIVERARLLDVPAARIGLVGGERLVISTSHGEFTWAIPDLRPRTPAAPAAAAVTAAA